MWIRERLNKKTKNSGLPLLQRAAPPAVRVAEPQLIRAFVLTLVPSGPDEEVFSVSEGDEQTCSRFILFISRSVQSNRADHTLN